MTTFLRLTVCLSVLSMTIAPAEGFGARLEPFSAHLGGHSSPGTSLRVFEPRRNKRLRESRDTADTENVLDLFDFPPAAFENLDDFVVAYSVGLADGTFSHLQEKADWLAIETFAENLPVVDSGDECGVECEECAIPEEWKRLPTMMESVDVMDFLGISRVTPLKVPAAVSKDAR